jgi:hypothetical protein
MVPSHEQQLLGFDKCTHPHIRKVLIIDYAHRREGHCGVVLSNVELKVFSNFTLIAYHLKQSFVGHDLRDLDAFFIHSLTVLAGCKMAGCKNTGKQEYREALRYLVREGGKRCARLVTWSRKGEALRAARYLVKEGVALRAARYLVKEGVALRAARYMVARNALRVGLAPSHVATATGARARAGGYRPSPSVT